jgi:hypothetical protein
MNKTLTKEIITHIYAHFAIVPSNFVNLEKTGSLMDPYYLLDEKINFEVEGVAHKSKIWGCQLVFDNQAIKILLADCSIDKNVLELAMIVQPKDTPTYGLYLTTDPDDSQPMIAVSPDNGKGWMECNIGLQATFLAAMEQLRDLHMSWNKCVDYKSSYDSMLSFLKFNLEA